MPELSNKTVIITGGARGQGRSHAVSLARYGANVAICDVAAQLDTVQYPMATPADVEETVALVQGEGGECLALQGDVAEPGFMDEVVARTLERFGRVDALVANAGIGGFGVAWEIGDAQWDQMIRTNLTGVWRSFKAVVPTLLRQGAGGSLVAISSSSVNRPYANMCHYLAAKQGVEGVMKSFALELAPSYVRVNCVLPTGVKTPMMMNDAVRHVFAGDRTQTDEEYIEAVSSLNAMPAFLDPVEVSHAVAWLVSDESRFVTGTTVSVDAGNALL